MKSVEVQIAAIPGPIAILNLPLYCQINDAVEKKIFRIHRTVEASIWRELLEEIE